MNILAIETSCDDTCAAVVKDGRNVLSNCIKTSAEEQNKFGGIVPEIASRRHIEYISDVTNEALQKAQLTLSDIDAVAVTFAPGLIGAVLVGVNFAKSLAYSINKPLIPVHHLRGHIASLYLTHEKLAPPMLCLVASGGHSHIVMANDYTNFTVLGRTLDDAAGEAFDKVARVLGLGYPGGPHVSKAAKNGNPNAYALPVPNASGKYNVSFSGLKTAVLNTVNKLTMKGESVDVNDMCASFQHRIAGILAEKLLLCAQDYSAKNICLAGGVAANDELRSMLLHATKNSDKKLFLPHMHLCTDNAAMVGSQAFYEFLANESTSNHTPNLNLNGYATLEIDYDTNI